MKWLRKIPWSKFYWPTLWILGTIIVVGLSIIFASLSGCATLKKVGSLIGFGKTIQADKIIYVESPFGWSLAAIFLLFKLWFWYQNRCKDKRLDRIYRAIEISEKNQCTVKELKLIISTHHDKEINRRVAQLFPKRTGK